jgi:signal transduction histidine kinase
MKITTRIIWGYGLFIAVLAGLVTYQVITIKRMREFNETIERIDFANASSSLDARRYIDIVEEFAQKSFASTDPRYPDQVRAFQQEFANTLASLIKNTNSADARSEEKAAVQRLSLLWASFTVDLEQLLQRLPEERGAWPLNLKEDLEQLKDQTDSVYIASKHSMSLKVAQSRKAGETARLVLWCATLSALAISVLVSFLIFRSISKPLAHLTEGTRAIAEGKFFYRLDTSRNDEFSQLAKDFNTMTRRLSELDELKKDFVSHVSHELKAPLASMRETIQLMLDQIPGPLTDKQKRLLELNLQSGERLTSMIGNLLDLSKTEAGMAEYELKSQNLVPLVRNAIAELEAQARERQIHISMSLPDNPLPVECDSDRLVQVILNLVGNAVKFSPKGGTVQIQVEAIPEIPEKMPEHWRRVITDSEKRGFFGLVKVTDSGPGIPDSDKEKVFEKFHQVKQGKKIAGQGVGLGLAICQTIVHAHRGAIWVEDNSGGGSSFSLLLRPGKEEEVPSQGSLPT